MNILSIKNKNKKTSLCIAARLQTNGPPNINQVSIKNVDTGRVLINLSKN